MTLAMVAVSVGWALLTDFALPTPGFFVLQGIATAVLGSIALIYIFLRPDPQLTRLLLNIILGFWFGGFAILFSYLCASTDRPLVDAELAAIDRALGIDWPAMVTWASTKPWITEWARFIYDRPLWELLVIVILLAILGRPQRVEEFISCFMVSGIVTAIIGAMLPADSGYAYFRIPSNVFTAFNAVVTPEYLHHFHALRSGELRNVVIGDVRGLVAFPSYHTAFALLLSYAVRDYKFLLFPSLVLNLAVVATTPFVGAHYVADVIGGVAVVAFAVWLVGLIHREKRAPAAIAQPGSYVESRIPAS
jgi:membrane-associated phospholipid phosphatase